MLTIAQDETIAKEVIISKGEIIYFPSGHRSKHLFQKIISGQFQNDRESGIGKTELSALRQTIGYVSNESYLAEEKSAQSNIELYTASLGIKPNKEYCQRLLQLAEIKGTDRVWDLSLLQKYCLRLIINIIKDPDLIIMEDPLSQIDKSIYKLFMDIIYEDISERGTTLIASISEPSVRDMFPGRLISLTCDA